MATREGKRSSRNKALKGSKFTAGQLEFVKSWPDTLFYILHTLHDAGVDIKPAYQEDSMEPIWVINEPGSTNMSDRGFPVELVELAVRINDPGLINEYSLLETYCDEYVNRKEEELRKLQRRQKALSELTEEQAEALGLAPERANLRFRQKQARG